MLDSWPGVPGFYLPYSPNMRTFKSIKQTLIGLLGYYLNSPEPSNIHGINKKIIYAGYNPYRDQNKKRKNFV